MLKTSFLSSLILYAQPFLTFLLLSITPSGAPALDAQPGIIKRVCAIKRKQHGFSHAKAVLVSFYREVRVVQASKPSSLATRVTVTPGL